MKRPMNGGGVCSVLLSMVLAGCSAPTETQIAAVRLELEVARDRQADRYLPAAYEAVEEMVARLEQEIEEQGKKSFWARRSGPARAQLAAAEIEVAMLKESTGAAVLAARKRAEGALEEARAAADRASAAYWAAPRGKDTRAEILRMRMDLEGIHGELLEVELDLEQGDFLRARERADNLGRRATDLGRTIERAMAHRLALLAPSAAVSGSPREVSPGAGESRGRVPGAPPLPQSWR